MELTSSAKPTAAMNSVAPKTRDGNFHLGRAGKGDDRDGRDQRGRDHRDACALRRRNAMGGARIRLRQRYVAPATAGSPMSGRADSSAAGTAAANDNRSLRNWPFYPRGKLLGGLFGNFDRRRALRCLLGAEDPDQPADQRQR